MEEISLFLAREFSQTKCRIVEVGNQMAWIDNEIGEAELAAEEQCLAQCYGGTDVALYAVLLEEIGIVLLTVITGLTINFLCKPPATQHITAVCTLLKVGRTLAGGEVRLYSEGYKNRWIMRWVPTRFRRLSVPRG